MHNARALLKDTLKKSGLSLTRARLMVFKVLQGYGPISMPELLSQTLGTVDRASVYRAISVFEKSGVAQRINLGNNEKLELSEIFEGHHHHFSCIKCGKLISIDDRQLESYIDNLPSLGGARVITHQLETQGICSNCLKLAY